MKILNYINKILPFLKKGNDKSKFNNILVVSNTGIGDTVLATPAIKTLRMNFPDINITFLVHKKMYPLFKNISYVNDFLIYRSGVLPQIKLIFQLRKKKIDTIFLFHSNGPEDIFFSVLSGANNILRMTENDQYKFKNILLNIITNEKKHIIEKKIDLVKCFDIKSIDRTMDIPIKKDEYIIKKEKGIIYIGFQIGAQDLYKIWSINNFIELSNRLLKEEQIRIVIFGATKLEQEFANKLLNESLYNKKLINLCGILSIEELPNAVNDLDLLVTNDTGTMHLAIALKIPTISLFGPTDSRIYGPYQDLALHKVIQKDGFFVNNVPKKQRTQEGINLISVDEVYESVKNNLFEIENMNKEC